MVAVQSPQSGLNFTANINSYFEAVNHIVSNEVVIYSCIDLELRNRHSVISCILQVDRQTVIVGVVLLYNTLLRH